MTYQLNKRSAEQQDVSESKTYLLITYQLNKRSVNQRQKDYGTSGEALPPSDAAGLHHHDRRHRGLQRCPRKADTGKGNNHKSKN